MSDFTEIENELKKLRPIEPSPEIFKRVERQIAGAAPEKIITPVRFRINWLSLGAGLAAAALLLLFAHSRMQQAPQRQMTTTASSPAGASTRSTITPAQFIPTGATQVVYHTQDEGLLFPRGSEQPVRRVRARTRETLQWQNPATGASLRVSYPAEEVTLLPVYGQ